MRRVATVLWLACGCNRVLGLDETIPLDAATFSAGPMCDPPYIVGGDFDGDGIPNPTDSCPHVAGPQPDGDGDGIGDACDPQPMSNDDCLLMFEDFRAPPTDCWRYTDWTLGCVAGETGLCSPTAARDDLVTFARLLEMSAVTITGEIVDAPTLGAGVGTFLGLDDIAPQATGTACQLDDTSGAQFTAGIVTWYNGTIVGTPSVLTTSPTMAFQAARVRLGWVLAADGGMLAPHCATSAELVGAPLRSTSRVVRDPAFTTGGRFAIRANHVRLRIDLVVGYGRGALCGSQ